MKIFRRATKATIQPTIARPGRKPCRFCREPIDREATLCKHCKMDQTRWRLLSFSPIMVALLTALVSVIALVAPIIEDVMTPDNSKFRFNLVSVSFTGALEPNASFYVSNSGRRSGVVSGGELLMRDGQNSVGLYVNLSTPVLVEGGSSALFRAPIDIMHPSFGRPADGTNLARIVTMAPDGKPLNIKALKDSYCTVALFIDNFDGNKLSLSKQVDCAEITGIVHEALMP